MNVIPLPVEAPPPIPLEPPEDVDSEEADTKDRGVWVWDRNGDEDGEIGVIIDM